MDPPRPAHWLVLGFLAIAFVATPSSLHADGNVTLSWDRPAGPGRPPIASRSFAGPGPVDLYVSVQGLSTPLQAFQVWLRVDGTNRCFGPVDSLAAAWRFDAGGCQEGRVCFEGEGFRELVDGPLEPGFESLNDLAPIVPGAAFRIGFAEFYPAAVLPDPTAGYTLLRLRFDHGASVLGTTTGSGCGGAEEEAYVTLYRASFLDATGNEIQWAIGPFDQIEWRKPPFATNEIACTESFDEPPSLFARRGDGVNSPIVPCDLPVPARAMSWGRLKSGYR